MKSNEQKCDMCKADLAKEQEKFENPCEYHARLQIVSALKDQHNSRADVWEAIQRHDAEARRAYGYNIERFGFTTTASAIFAGIVLVATGLAETFSHWDWDDLSLRWTSGVFYVIEGVLVVIGLKVYWQLTEKRLKEKESRPKSRPQ